MEVELIRMIWELRTGCRLHFGLMELAPGAPNRYAGLGAMLNQPTMQLRIAQSDGPECYVSEAAIDVASQSEYHDRILAWLSRSQVNARVELKSGYPFHSGLGSGTQLASLLAIAEKLLAQEFDISCCSGQWQSVSDLFRSFDPSHLAAASGRGLRSAIGLKGFLTGGLILDSGYLQVADHVERPVQATNCMLPSNWRFVLIRGNDNSSITGRLESDMIRSMASNPNSCRQRMMELAQASLEFAAAADFDQFCRVSEEYMQLAGDMFAPVQGGRYNGAVCSQAVSLAREFGLRAVGQSSWGPTIFGLASEIDQAMQAIKLIQQQGTNWCVEIASPAKQGAEIRFAID